MAFVSAPPANAAAMSLQRMQWIALLFLVAALCGLLLGHAMGNAGGWGWLRAFCEAAAIGAVADWFAVVALFRHPLGLKVPHTAIIPQSKERIADGLAGFVRDHFLSPDLLLARLAAMDPARQIGQWLAEPDRLQFWVGQSQRWALGVLGTLDDARLRTAVLGWVVAQARGWNAAPTVGDLLGVLTRDGRHQVLLDAGLEKLAGWLVQDEVKDVAAQWMVRHARQSWPRLVGTLDWMADASGLADNLVDRLSQSMLAELREVLLQPAHPLRQRYSAWFDDQVERLRTDPALVASVQALKSRALDDPEVAAYAAALWAEARDRLALDLGRKDSVAAGYLERGLRSVGNELLVNSSLREALNTQLLAVAAHIAEGLQGSASAYIAQTIKAWDDAQLVRALELQVGRDLQFIRINGTLVGGLIGLLLHAAAVFG